MLRLGLELTRFAVFCSLRIASSKVSCSRSWASWYSRRWVARITATM